MQLVAQLETITVGQQYVEHHHVERLSLEQLPHAGRIFGGAHVERVSTQVSGQGFADFAVVIHHQHARCDRHRGKRHCSPRKVEQERADITTSHYH